LQYEHERNCISKHQVRSIHRPFWRPLGTWSCSPGCQRRVSWAAERTGEIQS